MEGGIFPFCHSGESCRKPSSFRPVSHPGPTQEPPSSCYRVPCVGERKVPKVGVGVEEDQCTVDDDEARSVGVYTGSFVLPSVTRRAVESGNRSPSIVTDLAPVHRRKDVGGSLPVRGPTLETSAVRLLTRVAGGSDPFQCLLLGRSSLGLRSVVRTTVGWGDPGPGPTTSSSTPEDPAGRKQWRCRGPDVRLLRRTTDA